MWKDTTSYSQGDKERKQTTYTTKNGRIRITITCAHIYYPGQWVMHCAAPSVDTRLLKNCDTCEQAKNKAILLVKNTLLLMLQDIEEIKQLTEQIND